MVQKEIYDIAPTWAGIFEEGILSNAERHMLGESDKCFIGEAHCGNASYRLCDKCSRLSIRILSCIDREEEDLSVVNNRKYAQWKNTLVEHWNKEHKDLNKCVE